MWPNHALSHSKSKNCLVKPAFQQFIDLEHLTAEDKRNVFVNCILYVCMLPLGDKTLAVSPQTLFLHTP